MSEEKLQNIDRPYDARAVANLLLDIADSRNLKLTQLSLLKLLYFAQGWYLAKNRTPLIKQDFEAWEYGPVIKVVRDEFKVFGKKPITARAHKLDLYKNERVLVEPVLSNHDTNFVNEIFDAYHVYDAWRLSGMTHEKGSPWDLLWNATEPTGRLALRIRNDDIKRHFDGLGARFRVS
ncbi:DUF4065 domain-containing protein [Ferrovibrio terrae]|uniref:DUF4065 domain-containing protein n=1 Tax=Ferrovibrio terrae TaxID=2594003 RepID=A0A516GY37_9PROT|nr:type II toxin-antitoxin system antitoxin SocA domain-containing protein [Ferrovibrio terrae]QDO96443.1 DUF4065 domain-containing protein [Ferrovibrio terrae]